MTKYYEKREQSTVYAVKVEKGKTVLLVRNGQYYNKQYLYGASINWLVKGYSETSKTRYKQHEKLRK
jgi:hypothetical protein